MRQQREAQKEQKKTEEPKPAASGSEAAMLPIGEESSVETVEVLTPLPQAASLVQAMSTLIQKGGAAPEPFWPQITLKTQRVVDAVQQSWQQGGAKVAVAPVANKL